MLKTKTWQQIKDNHYGPQGSERRDALEKDAEVFRVGILIKQAREEKKLTQQQLADLVAKKRSYISRVENDGGNITLKTLVDIVEKGLGGRVELKIHSSK
jgi:ribosome-binding protein aMBF1 (putative translation factor)